MYSDGTFNDKADKSLYNALWNCKKQSDPLTQRYTQHLEHLNVVRFLQPSFQYTLHVFFVIFILFYSFL